MKRLMKVLAFLILLTGVAIGVSFAGMRVKVGQFLGASSSALGNRSTSLGRDTIPEVGVRLGWTVRYGSTHIQGLPSATIWVSPTGGILGTRPANLSERLAIHQRSRTGEDN